MDLSILKILTLEENLPKADGFGATFEQMRFRDFLVSSLVYSILYIDNENRDLIFSTDFVKALSSVDNWSYFFNLASPFLLNITSYKEQQEKFF